MGYDLYISKNKFIPAQSVQSIKFPESTKEVLVKWTILSLSGWNIAELFDAESRQGEIGKEELIEFYHQFCELEGIPPAQNTLDMISSDEDCFFSYDSWY